MATGKVKWYSDEKSFGFIIPDQGGSDVFVHKSALHAAGITSLKDNTPIKYDLIEDQKNGKLKAENIKI